MNAVECGRRPLAEMPLGQERNSKIIGGEKTTPGEFPFLVSLKYGGVRHFCGGSLISAQWILTAAHCVSGPAAEFLSVVLGEYDMQNDTEGESIIKIEKVFRHEEFQFSTLNNDIALVRLRKPVNYTDRIQPVCVIEDDEVTYLIGRLESSPDGDELRKVGDSGGPLFAPGPDGRVIQQGIVSSGIGCGRRGKPGVYTKLTAHLHWIVKTIRTYEQSLITEQPPP
ncbi:unnamed protein product [Notodromas monacha]|uniref:Peptidase S1 domain-containing protein n=1 Tax=Notodromas monacha TaxID=399045 RepID=A0A7R9GEP5_9CRUS|nr:unnamed protein product [Notodromas monacha]CAG0918487.1 unnamed protein product [Notodromas monacha]